jgi:MFS family permease
MIQAASTIPVFLLAIPAGVLSDILDRRKLLITMQLVLASVSATLMLLSHTGALTVGSLVVLTFVGGVGAALVGPTWQSIVPELVPRQDLKNAVALNSLGFNIARSIGPAAGGLLLAGLGAAVAYSADVVGDLIVISALVWWRRAPRADDELSEHFFGAFKAGLRYVRSSHELHVVLMRAAIFFCFLERPMGATADRRQAASRRQRRILRHPARRGRRGRHPRCAGPAATAPPVRR